jgi:uncharacterized protein
LSYLSPFSLARYFSPETFLEHAGAALCAAEVEHNLILGICDRLQRDRLERGDTFAEPQGAPYFATIETAGEGLIATAIMTPPHKVVLGRATPPEVTELFALDLAASDLPVPGVLGSFEAVAAFGERWTQVKDCAAHALERMGIYELREVAHPTYSPGELRLAEPADLELLAAWNFAFYFDVGMERDFESCRADVARLLADQALWVWDHRGPVSMAAVTRYTPHGAAVANVFTPSEMRGRGYATSAVATLSDQLLRAGRDFCCLFTQMSNPTSNAIYRRIGYRQVAEWEELFFV